MKVAPPESRCEKIVLPIAVAVLGPPLNLFDRLTEKALGQDFEWKPEPTRVEEALGWTKPPPPSEDSGLLPVDECGLRGLYPFHAEYLFPGWLSRLKLGSLLTRAGEPGVEIVRLLEFRYRQPPLAVELEIDPARMPEKPVSPATAPSWESQAAAYAAERRWGADAVGTLRHVTFKDFPERGEDALLVRGEATVFRREAAELRRCLDIADLWHERSAGLRDGAGRAPLGGGGAPRRALPRDATVATPAASRHGRS